MTSNPMRTAGASTLINPNEERPDTALPHQNQVWIHHTTQAEDINCFAYCSSPLFYPFPLSLTSSPFPSKPFLSPSSCTSKTTHSPYPLLSTYLMPYVSRSMTQVNCFKTSLSCFHYKISKHFTSPQPSSLKKKKKRWKVDLR